jgi:hypothetical protein
MKKKIVILIILVIAVVLIAILAFGGGIGSKNGGADSDTVAASGVNGEVREFANLDALVPEGFAVIEFDDDDHTIQILTDGGDNTPFIEFRKAGSGFELTEAAAKEDVLGFVKMWDGTGDDFRNYTIGGKTYYGATYTYTYNDTLSLYLVGEGTPDGKFQINIAGATLDDPNINAIIDSVIFN